MKTRNYIPWLYALMLCLLAQYTTAQCVVADSIPIPDDDEIDILIQVDSLLINDLALPGQGLCGVRVRFLHDHIGDLRLELQSPSGDIIILTGPVTNTGPTNFTVWDVTFLRCSDQPMPDPGFTDLWDNDQDWQSLGNYSGSYWPYSGCMETLTGPANGTWTLTAIDGQQIDVGVIEEVELIFCNDLGLACDECEADAGFVEPDTFFQCDGGPPAMLDLDPQYHSDPPDSPFVHFYVVTRDTNLIDVTGSIGEYNPGFYEICGLSIHHDDTSRIQVRPPWVQTKDDFVQWLTEDETCFSLANECAFFQISQPNPPNHIAEVICAGDTFEIDNYQLFEDSLYVLMDTAHNNCINVTNIALTVVNPLAEITVEVPFGCTQDTATLSGTDLTYGSDVDFHWYAQGGGTIVSAIDGMTISVVGSGTYFLVTTRTHQTSMTTCRDTAFVQLNDDFVPPQISVLPDTVSCTLDSVEITANALPLSSIIIWQEVGGSVDTGNSQVVYWGEAYTIVAVSPNGCRDSTTLIPEYDTIPPLVTPDDIEKPCPSDSVLITAGVSGGINTFIWITPSGDTVRQRDFTSTEVGAFTLFAAGENGCLGRSSLLVTLTGGTIPSFTMESDTFGCTNDSIQYRFTSNVQIDSFIMTSPDGDVTEMMTGTLSDTGTYDIHLLLNNGCTFDTTWKAPVDMTLPSIGIVAPFLDCVNDSVQLRITEVGTGYTYSWVGPGGFTSMSKEPFITAPGRYDVTVTGANGCENTFFHDVPSNQDNPTVSLDASTISCDNPSSHVIVTTDADSIQWSGPGFLSMDHEVDIPSIDTFHLYLEKDGCDTTVLFIPVADTMAPDVSFEVDTISCDQDSVQITTSGDLTDLQFEWQGDNGYSSTDPMPFVVDPGLYHVTATNSSNGCQAIDQIGVVADTNRPTLSVMANDLSCADSTSMAHADVTGSAVTIEWAGPNGMMDSGPDVILEEPGTYTVTASDTNGCRVQEVITIDYDQIGEVTLETDTLTCANNPATHRIISSDTVDVLWTLDDVVESGEELVSDHSGLLQVHVENHRGCIWETEVEVPTDTTAPNISLRSASTVTCLDSSAVIFVEGYDPAADWSGQWSVLSGEVYEYNAEGDTAFVAPGHYAVAMTSNENGCTSMDTIDVSTFENQLRISELSIQQPTCHNDYGASIDVIEVVNGTGSIRFSFDGGPPTEDQVFFPERGGGIVLEVIDDLGCTFDTSVFINDPQPLSVEAFEDMTVESGTSILLTSIDSLDPASKQAKIWTYGSDTLCTDCDDITIEAENSGHYIVTLVDTSGCSTSDSVFIEVIIVPHIYVPTAFSPNNDGVNDVFRPYFGPNIAVIRDFAIYSRWGECVFEKQDLPPDDPNLGWDGRHHGLLMDPAVFVWHLLAEQTDGTAVERKGEVHLIR